MENGRRYATPLLLVLLLVEATDLIFAVDSIPAIFGITRDPFLAVILTFVGTKMLIESWIHIPILLSLGVVLVLLAASIAGSLIWPQGGSASEGKTGSMFGKPNERG